MEFYSEYEFVDMRLLLDFLATEYVHAPSPTAHFAALVTRTGYDFC